MTTKQLIIDCRMIDMSGIGRYIRSVLRLLREVGQEPVTLLGHRNRLREHVLDMWEIIECTVPPYSPKEILELRRHAPSNSVFFSPHFNAPYGSLRGVSRLTTIHDCYHISEVSDLNAPRRLYARALYRNAVRRSQTLIAVSAATLSEIGRLVGVEPRSATVIHNYVDTERFRHTDALPESINGPYILYVGNTKPHKNLQTLVEAFGMLDHREVQLALVGQKDGFVTGLSKSQMHALDMPNVFFLGQVSDRELVRLYSHALCLVLPSLYEGFGYTPLEALACGTIPVVSDIPVLREILGDAALYFDPRSTGELADILRTVLGSTSLMEGQAAKGVARVKLFSKDRFDAQMTTILQQALTA